MKLIRTLLLALALSSVTACAQLQQALNVANLATASIANPVTPTMLYDMENGAIIAFAALNAYRRTCVEGTIPPSCKDVIRKIQVYTRQIPPYLKQLRVFVRTNDQVNAILIYNTVSGLITNARAEAAKNNVGAI